MKGPTMEHTDTPKTESGWPICSICNKSITAHYIHGSTAKCDSDSSIKAPFTHQDVIDVRTALGKGSTPEMRARATKQDNRKTGQ